MRLERLPAGDASPFAALPGVHFGRLTLVPHLKDRRGDQLSATSFLLLATEFDGTVEEHVARLSEPLREVLDECELDGASESWLLANRIRPGYSVAGYPGVTVEEVHEALALRVRHRELAVAARRMTPDELRRAWLERFA